jgi:putative membrane protein
MREPGVEDATRRTRLANERTYLAWWRTALTSLAVCIGVGRLVPVVAKGPRWPYELLGVGYGLLGFAFVVCAFTRTRAIDDAIAAGAFAPLPRRLMLALTIAGGILSAATVLVLLTVR